MNEKWTVEHDYKANDKYIGRFEAFYPEFNQTEPGKERMPRELPKYIRITGKDETGAAGSACFKTDKIIGGDGLTFLIHKSALSEVADTTEVSYEKIGTFRFRRYLVWNDKEQAWALAGFIVTLIGFVISGSLDLGKLCKETGACQPWFVESASVIAAKIFSLVLQAAGIILLFWKGLVGYK